MKRCSASAVIREIKKTRYHYTPMRMAKIQTLTSSNAGEDVEKEELSSLLVGMQDGAVTLEDSLVVS